MKVNLKTLDEFLIYLENSSYFIRTIIVLNKIYFFVFMYLFYLNELF